MCISAANVRRWPQLFFCFFFFSLCRRTVPALAFSLFGPFFLLLVCSTEPLSQRRSLSGPIYLMHNCPPLLSFYLFPSVSTRSLFLLLQSNKQLLCALFSFLLIILCTPCYHSYFFFSRLSTWRYSFLSLSLPLSLVIVMYLHRLNIGKGQIMLK